MKVSRLVRRVGGRDRLAIAAAAIAVVALIGDLAIVQPMDRQVAAKQRAVAEMSRPGASRSAAAEGPRAQLAAFYGRLPVQAQAPDVVRRLHLAARDAGVRLDHGRYQSTETASSALMRYQIVLPVSGTYPAIRAFIGAAMEDMPYLALEGLEIRRGDGIPAIEAELRLVAYLRAST